MSLPKDMQGRLNEILRPLQGVAIDTPEIRYAKESLTHLIEAYTEDMVVAELYRLKGITFDKNTWPSALTDYLDGRLEQLKNKGE